MIKVLKKEFVIYTALLSVLIFVMHPDMLSEPTVRLALMQVKSNYIHPLLYTFFVYLILYFVRFVFNFILNLIKKPKQ